MITIDDFGGMQNFNLKSLKAKVGGEEEMWNVYFDPNGMDSNIRWLFEDVVSLEARTLAVMMRAALRRIEAKDAGPACVCDVCKMDMSAHGPTLEHPPAFQAGIERERKRCAQILSDAQEWIGNFNRLDVAGAQHALRQIEQKIRSEEA